MILAPPSQHHAMGDLDIVPFRPPDVDPTFQRPSQDTGDQQQDPDRNGPDFPGKRVAGFFCGA
jgi:hypothetical protein